MNTIIYTIIVAAIIAILLGILLGLFKKIFHVDTDPKVQLVEFFLKKMSPGLYNAMGVYLALITTNCAVLGITINCIGKNYNYVQSLVYAFGSAMGFLISMVIMSGVRSRVKTANIPKAFAGTPILYVCASLLSLAFLGFKGLIK